MTPAGPAGLVRPVRAPVPAGVRSLSGRFNNNHGLLARYQWCANGARRAQGSYVTIRQTFTLFVFAGCRCTQTGIVLAGLSVQAGLPRPDALCRQWWLVCGPGRQSGCQPQSQATSGRTGAQSPGPRQGPIHCPRRQWHDRSGPRARAGTRDLQCTVWPWLAIHRFACPWLFVSVACCCWEQVVLNLTDIASGLNSYYILQVLAHDTKRVWCVLASSHLDRWLAMTYGQSLPMTRWSICRASPASDRSCVI